MISKYAADLYSGDPVYDLSKKEYPPKDSWIIGMDEKQKEFGIFKTGGLPEDKSTYELWRCPSDNCYNLAMKADDIYLWRNFPRNSLHLCEVCWRREPYHKCPRIHYACKALMHLRYAPNPDVVRAHATLKTLSYSSRSHSMYLYIIGAFVLAIIIHILKLI